MGCRPRYLCFDPQHSTLVLRVCLQMISAGVRFRCDGGYKIKYCTPLDEIVQGRASMHSSLKLLNSPINPDSVGGHSFSSAAPIVWNSLPPAIFAVDSFPLFSSRPLRPSADDRLPHGKIYLCALSVQSPEMRSHLDVV